MKNINKIRRVFHRYYDIHKGRISDKEVGEEVRSLRRKDKEGRLDDFSERMYNEIFPYLDNEEKE